MQIRKGGVPVDAATATVTTVQSAASRLDRLPICSWHRKLVILVGIGTFFDLYEVFLGGVLGATLATQWNLSSTGKALVISSGFIGMFVGAIALGVLADVFGRRRMFLINLGVYSAFSLAAAAAPNLSSLVVLRILAGLGLGAELTLVDTYLAEFLPSRSRGRYISWAYTLGFVAVPIVALAGARLVAGHDLAISGWRWLLVIGGLGAFVLWILRRRLPESPRWLATHDRGEEAGQVLDNIEDQVRTATRSPLPEPAYVPDEAPVRLSLGTMFGSAYRRRTVMLWIFQILQTVGYYGFGSLAPVVLVSKGYSIVDSLGYAALSYVGYPIGSALAIPLIERCERKSLIVGSALGIAAFGVVFGAAANTALIVFAGFMLTVCSNVFSNAYHVYQAEIFPTRIRSSAIGIAYSLSRATSAALPFIAISVLDHLGSTAVFVGSAVLMLGLCLNVSILGPNSTGRSLETVSS
ncbi:MAG TPA: MFS transporter [Mycobacteriales bacterium]|nr:MFS transporter [Mycobacteriales bacterium]